MKRKKLAIWQIALLSLAILLIMGAIVGKADRDSRQAILDEQVNIRDSLVRSQDEYIMNMILQSGTCRECHK